MQEDRIKKLEEFVGWYSEHVTGYEKGEGQIFFHKLVQAFGNSGILEIGAKCEKGIKKRKGSHGFVDFIWQPRVVIELKERGTKLEKHFSQLFEYWWSLRPSQPQYMILCNFDEFWIYDFTKQDDPVHKLKTTDLVSTVGAGLAFLYPTAERPVFNNSNEKVTIEAANTIGSMFLSMTKRKVDAERAQKFVLQIVVALFAEDVNLIPKNTIYKILEDAVKKDIKTQQEMADLFVAMSNKDLNKKPKKYKDIPYFNGGIFEDVDPIELNYAELDLLFEASTKDWSKVRPSIFGSIFESSMDQNKRHDLGAHFTSEGDIQKIVYPTIVMPIRKKIDAAKTKPALSKVLKEIREFKVLDPACGSGNFLYIAFKELRRLEVEVMELLAEKTGSHQMSLSMVSPKNFYGIDVNGFGIELAKVALCIGRKLSADEFKVADNILPFENLDDHFFKTDALFTKWPEVDAIIGNPPFLGSRKLRASGFSEEYIEKIRALYPKDEFPGNADFCCYWFRKAHDEKANYVGLVGSNSITQNESRMASLEYIERNKGAIHYAISTQVWSGDAAVHVSIVNWVKGDWPHSKMLDGHEVDTINSSLKNSLNISSAGILTQNKNICYQGVITGSKAFVLTQKEFKQLKLSKHDVSAVKLYSTGDNLTDTPDLKPNRYVIDFNNMTIEQASSFKEVFSYLKEHQGRKKDAKWWLYTRARPEMREKLKNLKFYFAIPRVSKWTIPVVQNSDYLLGDAAWAVCSDDFYLMGVLTSKLHRDWVKEQASSLKGDTRYTNTTCFETFPFLFDISGSEKKTVRNIMIELDKYRLEVMEQNQYGITKLYNQFFKEPSSKLYQLHEQLDKEVCKLYGLKYSSDKNYNAELFSLNQKMCKKEAGKQSSFLEDDAKTNSESLKSKKPTKRAKKK